MTDKLPKRSEITGVTETITSFGDNDSGPRGYMAFAQIQQAPKPKKPDLKYTLTGFEKQLAETTIAITMPVNAVVFDMASQHIRKGNTRRSAKTIIYQDVDTGVYDSIELEPYFKAHDIFGCEYILTPIAKKLHSNMFIPKDTVLAATGELETKGLYSTTVNAECCNLSLAGTIEDGAIVSEELLDRLSPIALSKREGSVGSGQYFVNTYGDENFFKPCPGHGEEIRPDKVIFAQRKTHPILDAVYMLEPLLNTIDFSYDETTYAPFEADGAKVVKLDVYSSPNGSRLRSTPGSMEDFLNENLKQKSSYCERIIAIYKQLKRKEGKALRLGDTLSELITFCLGDKPNENLGAQSRGVGIVRFSHKNKPCDEWQIFVTIAWRYNLLYGAKLTDQHGAKAVVCEIRPKSEMPHDEYGNICDYVQFGQSVFSRMNPGQEYEKYFNAALRDVSKDVKRMAESGNWEMALEHAYGLLKIISPAQEEHYRRVKDTPAKQKKYLESIISDGMRAVVPPDSGVVTPETIRRIKAYRNPDKGPVSYRDYAGGWSRTEDDVLIAPRAIMVLDKSSFKPMAVSTSRLQQHGLPSTTNKRTKTLSPTHENPGRSWAEAENRNLGHSMGGEAVKYVLDISSDPELTDTYVANMIASEHPFREFKHYDEKRDGPMPGSRTIGYIKNYLECMGVEITNKD